MFKKIVVPSLSSLTTAFLKALKHNSPIFHRSAYYYRHIELALRSSSSVGFEKRKHVNGLKDMSSLALSRSPGGNLCIPFFSAKGSSVLEALFPPLYVT